MSSPGTERTLGEIEADMRKKYPNLPEHMIVGSDEWKKMAQGNGAIIDLPIQIREQKGKDTPTKAN